MNEPMTPEDLKQALNSSTIQSHKPLPQMKTKKRPLSIDELNMKPAQKKATRIADVLLRSKKSSNSIKDDKSDLEHLNLESRKVFGNLVQRYMEQEKHEELQVILNEHQGFINKIQKLIQ